MAKIRHIAIGAEDTAKLAEFYKATFEMQEVGRMDSGNGLAIFLSDGYMNLAVLPHPKATEGKEGILHFGFQVDDAMATGLAAKEAGAKHQMSPRPRDGRFAEFRIHDPVGTGVDLAEKGWAH